MSTHKITFKKFLVEQPEHLHAYVKFQNSDSNTPDYKFVKSFTDRPTAERFVKDYNSTHKLDDSSEQKLILLSDTVHKDFQKKK